MEKIKATNLTGCTKWRSIFTTAIGIAHNEYNMDVLLEANYSDPIQAE